MNLNPPTRIGLLAWMTGLIPIASLQALSVINQGTANLLLIALFSLSVCGMILAEFGS